MTDEQKIQTALAVLERYGQCDRESHHQTWLIDQMVRALTGDKYQKWVSDYRIGEHGETAGDPFDWSEGIPP